MQDEQISTEGPIHKYCSIQLAPHDLHGTDQLHITFEQCL